MLCWAILGHSYHKALDSLGYVGYALGVMSATATVNELPAICSVEDVAAFSRRSAKTVRHHHHLGRIKSLPRLSKQEPLRFVRAEVLRYLGLGEEKPEGSNG